MPADPVPWMTGKQRLVVLEMMEQMEALPMMVSQSVVQRQTLERVSERGLWATKILSQDQMLRRTVEQYLDVSVEVDKIVFPERILEKM